MATLAAETPAEDRAPIVYRHKLVTRVWHWLNAAVLLVLLMSGLMIFNAHPRLYWGKSGFEPDRAWLQIGPSANGGRLLLGSSFAVPTTGVLGRWTDADGNVQTRAFPGWATIPSHYDLAGARRWHLSFAWALGALAVLYLAIGAINRHIGRDLLPRRDELSARHLWHDIKDHARLRLPTGEAAARYNILQKLAYCGVVLVLIPLIILTGLVMSPSMDAAIPWVTAVLGGRQSARSIHFLCAFGLVAFTLIHLAMVLLAGPFNEVRSMVTGWFRLPADRTR